MPQVFRHVESGSVTVPSPFGQGLQAYPFQLLGNRIVQLPWGAYFQAADAFDDFLSVEELRDAWSDHDQPVQRFTGFVPGAGDTLIRVVAKTQHPPRSVIGL